MNRISRPQMLELHAEIHQNPALKAALDRAVASGAVMASASGNAGDGLIHLGAYELLRRFGNQVPVICEREIADMQAGATLIMVGGGMIEGIWDERMRALRDFLARDGKVIILPCSLYGFDDLLRAHASQITLFARDAKTYADARAAGLETVHQTHDLAFAIAPSFYDEIEGLRTGELNAFRTDAESATHAIPFGNLDLSLLWNGDIWCDRVTTEARCRLLAKTLVGFAKINTDRLHLGILGAALGLEVEIHDSISPKIQEIYRATLHRLSNVDLIERPAVNHGSEQTAGGSLLDYARDLARLRREWYEPELARRQDALQEALNEIARLQVRLAVYGERLAAEDLLANFPEPPVAPEAERAILNKGALRMIGYILLPYNKRRREIRRRMQAVC